MFLAGGQRCLAFCCFVYSMNPLRKNNGDSVMKKSIMCAAASLTLLLGMGSVFAAPGYASTQLARKMPSERFLFVLSSAKGYVKKINNTEYVLVMHLANMNQVTMFSDRPNRVLKTISGKELQKLWTEGVNSFGSNPPNAVLSSKNMRPVVVTLTGVRVKGDLIQYKFKLLKTPIKFTPTKVKSGIVLTIDSLRMNPPSGIGPYV